MIKDNLLKGKPEIPGVDEIIKGLVKFYEVINRDLQLIPEGYKSIVAYEDLIENPVECIRRSYMDLGLSFGNKQKQAILAYMEENKTYRKIPYVFGDEEKMKVYQVLKEFFGLYNYPN
jgi:hypothetical protein